jgi:hypothetical protein
MENSLRLTAVDSSITPVVPHLESAACLDVMLAKKFVSAAEIQAGKTTLVKIVSMLYGLIRANSDVRVFEESASYRTEKEGEKGRKQQE